MKKFILKWLSDVCCAVTKIVVIDDSPMMRLFLLRSLEKASFEVEEWMPLSAMEIPEHITASAPDLIISDYQMPGCNGATVARMVHKAMPNIPVVILTAFRDEEMESNLLRFGVRKILYKPIEPGTLVQVVKDILLDPAPKA